MICSMSFTRRTAGSLMAAFAAFGHQRRRRPNILYVMTDDHPAGCDALDDRRAGGRLDTDDTHVWRQLRDDIGDPRHQPTTADRDVDRLDIRHVFEDLQRDRAVAGDDVAVGCRVDEGVRLGHERLIEEDVPDRRRVALLERSIKPAECGIDVTTNRANFRQLKRVPRDVSLPQFFIQPFGIFRISQLEIDDRKSPCSPKFIGLQRGLTKGIGFGALI